MIFKTCLRFILGPSYLGKNLECDENVTEFNSLLEKSISSTQMAIIQPNDNADKSSQKSVKGRELPFPTGFAVAQYISVLLIRTVKRRILTFEYPNEWSYYDVFKYTLLQKPVAEIVSTLFSSLHFDMINSCFPYLILSPQLWYSSIRLLGISNIVLPFFNNSSWVEIVLLLCFQQIPHFVCRYSHSKVLGLIVNYFCTIQLDRLVASKCSTPFRVRSWSSYPKFSQLILPEMLEIIVKFGLEQIQLRLII